jgi:hypothetical protein
VSGPYGFGVPEILERLQRERALRGTISAEREWRRKGLGLPFEERFARNDNAHAYDVAATIRMMQPRFRLSEAWDAILERIGL